jgi:subtilisin family serine protease
MKIQPLWNLILFLTVSLFQTSTAQSNYYWSNNEKIELTEDYTSVIVHLNSTASVSTQASRLSTDNDLKSIEIHEAKNSMILFLKDGIQRSAEQWKTATGIDPKDIKSISPALKLEDGFPLWNTHKVVLRLKRGISLNLLEEYLSKHQAWVREEQFGNVLIETDQITNILPLANEIKESGLVEYAHPDFYAVVTKFSDPLYPYQFQMHNTGQTIDGHTGQVDCDVDAPEAWAITTGSPNIKIAVIDDGLEGHEDFNDANGNSRLLTGYTPANNGNGTPKSSGKHGVPCAGIITASHNNLGVKGLAPDSKFFSVNIFYGGESTSDLAAAFNWSVNNGADVISNSWGYSSCSLNFSVLTNAINNAANNGRNGLGCAIVFASGNNNFSCVTYPGNLDSVIAVGAVTNKGVRSYYSNYGADLDVVAPSNGAAGVRSTDRMGSAGYTSSNYTSSFGGTSAACPAVAGVAALTLAANPNLTSSTVRSIISTTADDMGPTGPDSQYGNGRANAHQAVLCAQAGGNCTGGGGGGGGGTSQYCNSQGNSVSYEWINSFSLGSFTNTSGTASSGYSDHTDQIISLSNGNTYPVSISPGFSGTVYNEYYRIWIDFNNDMDFDDPGEQIFSGGPTSGTASGTISIPNTTYQGNTRMRVSQKYSAFPTPCEVFAYGEVEDYTVDLGGNSVQCDAPSTVFASNIGINTATINWSPVTEANSYDIRYRKLGTSSWTIIPNYNNTSVNLNALQAGSTYTVQVSSNCAESTDSPWSGSTIFTCLEEEPCPAPEDLQAGDIEQYSARLTWTEVSEAEVYDLRYRKSSLGSWTYVSNINTTEYLLTDLEETTSYIAEIRSDCSLSDSEWSEQISFTTSNGCNSPTGLESIIINPTEVELFWNEDTLHLYYQLRLRTEDSSEWDTISPIDEANYYLTDLNENTVYEWQVSGVCQVGNSPWSFKNNFLTPVDSTCYLPDAFEVSSLSFNSATLSWSSTNLAQTYTLRYRTSGNTVWTTITDIDQLSNTIDDLLPETNYEAQLQVDCSTGENSGWSDLLEFTTTSYALPGEYCDSYGLDSSNEWIDYFAMSNVENTTGNDGGYLHYTNEVINLEDDSKYYIYFSKDAPENGICYFSFFLDFNMNGVFESNEMIRKTMTYFNSVKSSKITIPANLPEGYRKLRVVLKYYNSAEACEVYDRGETEDYIVYIGSGDNLQDDSASITNEESTEDIPTRDLSITLSPNPSSDYVRIDYPEDLEIISGEIINMGGKSIQVITPEAIENVMDVSSLKPGMYFIQFNTSEGILSRKLIIH